MTPSTKCECDCAKVGFRIEVGDRTCQCLCHQNQGKCDNCKWDGEKFDLKHGDIIQTVSGDDGRCAKCGRGRTHWNPITTPQSWEKEFDEQAKALVAKYENDEVGKTPLPFNSLAVDKFIKSFISHLLERSIREERGLERLKTLAGKAGVSFAINYEESGGLWYGEISSPAPSECAYWKKRADYNELYDDMIKHLSTLTDEGEAHPKG